jgi:hypothetical protein
MVVKYVVDIGRKMSDATSPSSSSASTERELEQVSSDPLIPTKFIEQKK